MRLSCLMFAVMSVVCPAAAWAGVSVSDDGPVTPSGPDTPVVAAGPQIVAGWDTAGAVSGDIFGNSYARSACQMLFPSSCLGIEGDACLRSLSFLMQPADYGDTSLPVRIRLAAVERQEGFGTMDREPVEADFEQVYEGSMELRKSDVPYSVVFPLQTPFVLPEGRTLVVDMVCAAGVNDSAPAEVLAFDAGGYMMMYAHSFDADLEDFDVSSADTRYLSRTLPVMGVRYDVVPADPAPDMSVISFAAPEAVVAGEEAVFSATVANVGSVPVEECELQLVDFSRSDEGVVIASRYIPGCAPGDEMTESMGYVFEKEGWYCLSMRAVLPDDAVPADNTGRMRLVVVTGPDGAEPPVVCPEEKDSSAVIRGGSVVVSNPWRRETAVYDASGMCLYEGDARSVSVPLRSRGTCIVRIGSATFSLLY